MKTDLRVLRTSDEDAGTASAQPGCRRGLRPFPAQVLRAEHGEAVILCHGREWRAALASQVPGVIVGSPCWSRCQRTATAASAARVQQHRQCGQR